MATNTTPLFLASLISLSILWCGDSALAADENRLDKNACQIYSDNLKLDVGRERVIHGWLHGMVLYCLPQFDAETIPLDVTKSFIDENPREAALFVRGDFTGVSIRGAVVEKKTRDGIAYLFEVYRLLY